MKRIVNTALAAVASVGALALLAPPATAQMHSGTRSGSHFSGGFRSGGTGFRSGGTGFRSGGFRGGYYGGGWGWGWGGWWPGYYPYYGYNNGCWVWSPYYGRYVVDPYCSDYY